VPASIRTRVKICGITNSDDALAAVDAGADALGFVFFRRSPRFIAPDLAAKIVRALPPFVTTVGVFVDEKPVEVNRVADACGLTMAQLHGAEDPDACEGVEVPVVKAFRVQGDPILSLRAYAGKVSGFLLDTFVDEVVGGTGKTFDWELAVQAKAFGRIILAGGITPDNVSEAIARVRPHGIDVSSGVEIRPGRKDRDKIERLLRTVAEADARLDKDIYVDAAGRVP